MNTETNSFLLYCKYSTTQDSASFDFIIIIKFAINARLHF